MHKLINNIRFISILFLLGILNSCIGKSSKDCKRETQNYSEKWDFIVYKVYKHPEYKATFVIEGTSGEKIVIEPMQDIVAFAEPGDKIIKKDYSKYAYWINSYNDTTRSRIFSTFCDSIVEARTKNLK
ncbi:MAG: hypothetical protein ABI207_02850 [Crocinitomicaceae bacterium]